MKRNYPHRKRHPSPETVSRIHARVTEMAARGKAKRAERERDELVDRLLKALPTVLTRKMQFCVITSFMSVDDLRRCVETQEVSVHPDAKEYRRGDA